MSYVRVYANIHMYIKCMHNLNIFKCIDKGTMSLLSVVALLNIVYCI